MKEAEQEKRSDRHKRVKPDPMWLNVESLAHVDSVENREEEAIYVRKIIVSFGAS